VDWRIGSALLSDLRVKEIIRIWHQNNFLGIKVGKENTKIVIGNEGCEDVLS
jgi:hypothetical protein